MSCNILHGDNLEALAALPDDSIDAIVTDPPYGLGKEPDAAAMLRDWMESGHHEVKGAGFMGKKWDAFVPQPVTWRECLRVLKPGGHLLSFAGTRTQDLVGLGLRLAGFELRDVVMWVYSSGFPKNHNISKAIDKHGGKDVGWFGNWLREWRQSEGITQKEIAKLFPSKTGGLTGCVANWELGFNMPTCEQFNAICEAFRLPFESIQEAEREVVGSDIKGRRTSGRIGLPAMGGETEYHTWNITAPATPEAQQWDGWGTTLKPAYKPIIMARKPFSGTVAQNVLEHGTGALHIDACRVGCDILSERVGRWPANFCHDGSQAVLDLFPQKSPGSAHARNNSGCKSQSFGKEKKNVTYGYNDNGGSAARYFYCAKASKSDKEEGNTHPTVKPTALMRWLVRMVCPPGGTVLDPYCGSGSTGKACREEGFGFLGIDADEEYVKIARRRAGAEE